MVTSSAEDFPLGRHFWLNVGCSDTEVSSILTLTRCQDAEFTCSTGHCVAITKVSVQVCHSIEAIRHGILCTEMRQQARLHGCLRRGKMSTSSL